MPRLASPACLVTLGAIALWALLSAVSRVLLVRWGLDPWTFSFLQLCAGGLALLAVSGRGALDATSFRRVSTWVLGALRVLSAALYTSVLAWISVLETGVLSGLNLPVIALIVWLFLGQRPARGEWVGHLAVLAALGVLAAELEGGIRSAALGVMALNAACLAAITLLAERHPDNISDRPGARTRFTGAVLLVTAALFLAARLAGGGGIGDLGDPILLAASLGVGVALRAPAMLLAFWSIRLAGAQGYTAAVSLLPVFGMLFEQGCVALGLLEDSRFQTRTLVLALAVIAGTLGVLAARARAARAARAAETQGSGGRGSEGRG